MVVSLFAGWIGAWMIQKTCLMYEKEHGAGLKILSEKTWPAGGMIFSRLKEAERSRGATAFG